jgi:hypothetical protein
MKGRWENSSSKAFGINFADRPKAKNQCVAEDIAHKRGKCNYYKDKARFMKNVTFDRFIVLGYVIILLSVYTNIYLYI